MNFPRKDIAEIIRAIRAKASAQPKIGIVCGSGLSPEQLELDAPVGIPFSRIPRFPVPSVKGHAGRFVLGTLDEQDVIVQEGRFHYYEGLPFDKILLPIFVMKELGVHTLVVTNAAGGVNPRFRAGDIMAVTNHINLMGVDPLIGRLGGAAGPRFVDMRKPYDEALIGLARACARRRRMTLREGVYLGDTGPHYETEAEVKAFRTLGADAVGMSLVPETIFARYLGLRVLALSVITNIYTQRMQTLSHEEVVAQGKRSAAELFALIGCIIGKMP
ncbi:MAG TPA: purine-nucleoside phosphorylase [bacterium]|nr:purine-nucleoside phosphorylase [bacterium]